ncbi:MAG: hypothetical protein AAFY55_17810 [Bacteroidota bacterium]
MTRFSLTPEQLVRLREEVRTQSGISDITPLTDVALVLFGAVGSFATALALHRMRPNRDEVRQSLRTLAGLALIAIEVVEARFLLN